MSVITLCPPGGGFISSPTDALIQMIMLNEDAQYWEQGSGDVGFHRDDDDRNLICQYGGALGFCVLFEAGPYAMPKVLLGNGALTKRLQVRLSGNSMIVPECYFVSAERALQTALAFTNERLLVDEVAWTIFDPEIA